MVGLMELKEGLEGTKWDEKMDWTVDLSQLLKRESRGVVGLGLAEGE